MEITSDNYLENESQIITDIQNCDFISIDLEMTGISQFKNKVTDDLEERYQTLKTTAQKFRIMQFGVVPWKSTISPQSQPHFTAKPYKIYVFPAEDNGNMQLNCEVKSIIFMKENKFDFNKWIYKGVRYLNNIQYKKLTDSILEGDINLYEPNDKNKHKSYFLQEDDITKGELIIKKINELFSSTEQKISFDIFPKRILYYILNKMQKDKRDCIYIRYETNDNRKVISFEKTDIKGKEDLITVQKEEKIKSLSKAKGVKNIFDAIVNSHKPVVGHHNSLDLAFSICHFGDILPKTYSEYKKIIVQNFTEVYDTKMIFHEFADKFTGALNDPYDSTVEYLYNYFSSKFKSQMQIEIPKDKGFMDYLNEKDNEKEYHQADYDAFITGCIFLYMKSALGDNAIRTTNYKSFIIHSFYRYYDYQNEEEYEIPNTVPYCLKSKGKSCEFDLSLYLPPDLFDLVKKTYFIEYHNSLLILVNTHEGLHLSVKSELVKNGANAFEIMSFSEFKKVIREENDKKGYNKTNNN